MAKGRGAEPRSVASLSHGRLMVGHYVHHNLMLANLVPNELHCDIVPDCPDGLVMLVIVVFCVHEHACLFWPPVSAR